MESDNETPPPLETPPERLEFDLDRRLEKALKEMLEAHEALDRASAGGSLEEFAVASSKFDEKNAEYERAQVAKGWRPPWPPTTEEGRAIWGVELGDIERLTYRSQG